MAKRRKDDEPQYLLLGMDPQPFSGEPDSSEPEDDGITPWGKRRRRNAPNALTAEELLGGAPAGDREAPAPGPYEDIPMRPMKNAADSDGDYSPAARFLFHRMRRQPPESEPDAAGRAPADGAAAEPLSAPEEDSDDAATYPLFRSEAQPPAANETADGPVDGSADLSAPNAAANESEGESVPDASAPDASAPDDVEDIWSNIPQVTPPPAVAADKSEDASPRESADGSEDRSASEPADRSTADESASDASVSDEVDADEADAEDGVPVQPLTAPVNPVVGAPRFFATPPDDSPSDGSGANASEEQSPDRLDATRVIDSAAVAEAAARAGAEGGDVDLSKTAVLDLPDGDAPKKRGRVALFGDEEEDVAPEELPPSFSREEPDEIDDYHSVEDAEAVRTEFSARRRRLRFRTVASLIAAALLGVLASPVSPLPFPELSYCIVVLALLAFVCVINFNTMRSVVSLFTLRADGDCASALAAVGALAQTVILMICGSPDALGVWNLTGAAACLALACNAAGKLSMVTRTLDNFERIVNSQIKSAAVLIEPPYANRIARGAVVGDSLICAQRKTVNLRGFLKHSLSYDPYELACRKLVPICFAAALPLGAAGWVLGRHPAYFGLIFSAALCVSAPLTGLLLSNFGLKSACRRLRAQGAVLTGYSAAQRLSEANVLALNASDLFSDDNVKLYNIKTFGDHVIDRAILDAAALTIESGAPISAVFDRMIEGQRKILPPVDSALYEEKMGLTGLVEGRKTIIGNRMVMEAHGIPVPSMEVDRKILRAGHFPVYLASEGTLAALFIVGYTVDEGLAVAVRRLVNTGVTLLVRTCDPNISEEMLADYFGVYRDYVSVMPDNAARMYQEVTAPAESEEALLSCEGDSPDAKGFVSGVVAGIRLISNVSIAIVLQIIGVAFGLALTLFFLLSGAAPMITVPAIVGYQIVFALITLCIHLFRKP